MRQVIKTKNLIYLLLIILTFVFCLNTVSAAKEIYVNTTGNDITGTGTAKNPYHTIQKGIDNVGSNGVLKIANGQYYGVKNTNITLQKNIKIIGQSPIKTIINGKGINWILKIRPGVNVTIYNLKLINGYTSGRGGAIQNLGNLSLKSCCINNNIAAEYGGGIYNTGNCMVNGCTITKNKQTGTGSKNAGGGIVNYGGNCTIIKSNILYNSANANSGGIGTQNGKCTIINCNVKFNRAKNGGGIVNYAGTCGITNCNISYNSADIIGGIGNQYGYCTIKKSIIRYNRAKKGAGIANYDGTTSISKCFFTNNTATGDGGSILNYCIIKENSGFRACVLNLNGCVFRGNFAGGDGGAVFSGCGVDVVGRGFGACVLNLNGCVFRNNLARGDGGAVFSGCGVDVVGRGFGACVLNLNGCVFRGNFARGDGGAIKNGSLTKISGSGATKDALNVNECTFTSNSAGKYGGAIWNHSKANFHFNRIVGNKAHIGNNIYSTYTMNASDNWWGSNNPDFKSLVFTGKNSKLTHIPWLYLTFTAKPNVIPAGHSSILIADFNHHTDGKKVSTINPVNGHIPNGTPVIFSTNLGSVGNGKSVVKYTHNGWAYALLHGDEGTGRADTKLSLDYQELNTSVIVTHSVNEASNNKKTIGMQKTGSPLTGLVMSIIMVIAGLISARNHNK